MTHAAWVAKWFADGAEENLRLGYQITEDSIVFDVGAYDGGWTVDLLRHTKAHPYVYLFEPLRGMCSVAAGRLQGEKVRVETFALSDKDGSAGLYDCSHESSMHKPANCQIQTCDIAAYINEVGVKKIDLMSLNIEGHEYSVLNRLLDTGLVCIIDHLQIQFHDFVPNAGEMRAAIRQRLAVTHMETYCYPFVWESWKRK